MKLNPDYFSANLYQNIKCLEEYYPELFEILKDYVELRYFLIFDDRMALNILDKESDQAVFNGDEVANCISRYSEYINGNAIYRSTIFGAGTTSAKKANPIHVETVDKLNAVAVMQEIKLKRTNTVSKVVRGMTVFGSGVGIDIYKMYMDHDIRDFYLVEPNFDFLYAFFQVVPFYEMVSKAVSNGYSLKIISGGEQEEIVNHYENAVFSNGRYNSNSMYFYSTDSIDRLSDISELIIRSQRSHVLAGFGFYDDSRLSLSATLENIRKKVPSLVQYKGRKTRSFHGLPVFIIGSGPSIDSDIDFIKNNADRSYIVSCGSAIKILHKNGIKPDLHVEIERTALTYTWLKQVQDDEYLSEIDFIGLSLLHPPVFDLFRRRGMLFKSSETGSLVVADKVQELDLEYKIPLFTNVNPTVVHFAAGVLPFFGFKDFYFFGVDMGYVDAHHHHSKSTSYEDVVESRKSEFVSSDSFEVKSNFADSKILTNTSYVSFRLVLEKIIQAGKVFSAKYYNCSNGAYIAGSESLRKDDIEFLNNKDADINDYIYSEFFLEGLSGDIQKNGFDIESLAEIDFVLSVCERAKSILNADINTIEEAEHLLEKFRREFMWDETVFDDRKWVYISLFFGSLNYYFCYAVRVLYYRTDDQAENLEYFKSVLTVLVDFFDQVSSDYTGDWSRLDKPEYWDYFNGE